VRLLVRLVAAISGLPERTSAELRKTALPAPQHPGADLSFLR